MSEQPVETLYVTVLRSELEELRAKAASLPLGVPDAEWVMHLLNDRWPESSERVEVELFAEWLREVIAPAAQPVVEQEITSVDDLFLDTKCALCGDTGHVPIDDPVDADITTVPCWACEKDQGHE